MTAPTCACGQPSPDAYLCHDCTARLQRTLLTAATLAPELDTALARLARFADRTTRGSERVLPYDPRAAEAAHTLEATLRTWRQEIA